MTWAWVGALLSVQLGVSMMGGTSQPWPRQIFYTLGLTRTGIFEGKVWQIFTYAFLHGGWWHVGLNVLWMVLVGSRIEFIAGARVFSMAIFFGILGGAMGHLILAPGGEGASILVGVSGACLALLLLLTTLSPDSRMMPIPVSGKNLGWGLLMAAFLLAVIHPALGLPGLSAIGRFLVEKGMGEWFQMGHACHFGGGVAGWIYGRWLLRPRVTLEQLCQARAKQEEGVADLSKPLKKHLP